MSKRVIMLVCSGGMSTSLLAANMVKVADQIHLDVDVFAVPMSDAVDFANKHTVDVLLVGPQIRYMLTDFKNKLASTAIPISVIPMKDYGMMDGKSVLAFADELIKNNA
ncbi:PTS sugar transporter subunit IIB [Carnobacterium sp.]|uniref:PTS sugar transporter subunit IIB n=1 Tax=Carnobacterium sp. TaxID=48221 RepID=UPI003C76141F